MKNKVDKTKNPLNISKNPPIIKINHYQKELKYTHPSFGEP